MSPVLGVDRLSMTFGGIRALDGVSLDLRAGEIHGLVGVNGSGKSTLVKVLAGYHHPDPGASVSVHGRPIALPLDPGRSHALGFYFIHQDLALISSLSVLENMRVLQYETSFARRIAWRRERAAARVALERFGLRAELDRPVSTLSPVQRALLAIARALGAIQGHPQGGMLVMDEPTASLPRDGVETLFDAVRVVVREGAAVLFVSHRLEEIRALTSRVSVLRDGRRIATVDTAAASDRALVELILGRSSDEMQPEQRPADPHTWMRVRSLSGARVADVSLDLRRGEVLGLTGLVGMGHEQIPYLLYGAETARTGVISVGERTIEASRLAPRLARELGMVLLPADRQAAGGVPGFALTDNVTLPVLRRYFRRGVLRHRQRAIDVTRLLESGGVRPAHAGAKLGELSGGNQQKALLVKWLQCDPELLLLHEPTQGVDVGAKREILGALTALAGAGSAIVVSSSDYDDLARVCDRVLVFRDGRVVDSLHGAHLTSERIVQSCFRPIAADGAIEAAAASVGRA